MYDIYIIENIIIKRVSAAVVTRYFYLLTHYNKIVTRYQQIVTSYYCSTNALHNYILLYIAYIRNVLLQTCNALDAVPIYVWPDPPI